MAVDTARRILTLDRDIELSGTVTGENVMSFIGANGKPMSATVTLQPDKNKVVLNAPLEGIMDGSVWGLKPATLRRRLFRCVAIAEKEDGSYSISALQHVPEKEAIVDKGTTFDLEEVKATVLSQTPPKVLHLTADIQPATDGYQITAHWDTPQLIKGGQFQVKLLTQDIEPRLVSQTITTETTHTFRELTQGDYTLCVRAMNAEGRLGEATKIAVPIHAPAAPIDVKTDSGFYSVTLTPRLALIPQVPTQFDFYFSGESPLTMVGEVESLGTYQGTGTSWTTSDLRVGTPYYWYVRTVNVLGKSDWVEVVASCQTDTKSLLDDFTGQITKTQLGQDVLGEIDDKAPIADLQQEARLRIMGDKQTDESLTALQSQFQQSTSAMQQKLSTLNDAQTAYAGQVTDINTSLKGKADATALSRLQSLISEQGTSLSNQSLAVTQLTSSLTGLTNRVNILETEKVTLLDLATLDANTWYPVTLNLNSLAKRWSFRLYRSLSGNEAPHPIWSRHPSGFSLELIWSVMGSGWGSQDIERLIDAFQYLWVKDSLSPVMGPTQMTHSSTEVIYLRGGARYHFVSDKAVTPTVRNVTYTVNSQSVSPRAYDVNLVPKTINQRGEATASATETLKTLVSTINGQITAQATQMSTLSAKMGSQQAAVQQTASALATLDGKVRAKAGLKVQANSAGKKVVTGIEMEASSAGDSQLLIKADTFAVISALNGDVTTPFMVNAAGQVVVNEALMDKAWIQKLVVLDYFKSSGFDKGNGFLLDAKNNVFRFTSGNGGATLTNQNLYVKDETGYNVVIIGDITNER